MVMTRAGSRTSWVVMKLVGSMVENWGGEIVRSMANYWSGGITVTRADLRAS